MALGAKSRDREAACPHINRVHDDAGGEDWNVLKVAVWQPCIPLLGSSSILGGTWNDLDSGLGARLLLMMSNINAFPD